MFGGIKQRIKIKIFTDSKTLLESIGSTHQIQEKILRQSIQDMKDVLEDGHVESLCWLDGEVDMVANVLTKECKRNPFLDIIVIEDKFLKVLNEDNIVRCVDGEVRILNKCNKSKEKNAEPMHG